MQLNACSGNCDSTRDLGFSLVELVTVIAVAGLIAAIAVPRFVGPDTFKSRGFYDEATGVVRFAQKTAIAWRSPVFVCVAADSVRAGTAAGCATPITHPTTGGPLVATAPAGVTLSVSPLPAEFSFNGLGRPTDGKMITLTSTIPGDPPRQIAIAAETGYVYHP